ncbi:MAG: DUF2147 domain-containing protein [Cytophagales bacterium]
MKRIKASIVLFLLVFFFSNFFAQAQQGSEGDKILGLWEVGSKKARIKIFKSNDLYYGKIVWLKEPNYEDGTPKIDKNNPDEAKRNVRLLGYNNLKSFKYIGDNKWEEGTIYDPENGNTYSCAIALTDQNTLDVRGFIGVTLFGRTDTWIRLVVKK